MEGADVAFNHQTAPFFAYFGTGYVNTGANEAITSLAGLGETIASGLDYYYFGGYDAHYKIDVLSTTTGTAFLESEDQLVRAVYNTTDTYKTICSSPLLGAFANGAELNLRALLMGQYIDFLGFDTVQLLPPQNVVVDPNTGVVSWDPPEPCPGAELQGYNLYFDGILLAFLELTEYQLEDLINGVEYTISISAVYDLGESEIVTVIFFYEGTGAGNNILVVTDLKGNYPNPFNPVTNIGYSIKEAGNVTLEVYNLRGQLVKILVNETKETGDHTTTWNGTDNTNKTVSSGVYLYKMKSSNYTSNKKMILLK